MRALCRNALAVLMLSLAGLPSPGGHSAASTREPARTAQPDSASAGRFIPVYKAAKQDDNKAEARQWREWKILEDFSEAMNDYIRIPNDIQVVAEECEEPNAFYQANVISLCYELGVSEREMFTQADNDADEVNDELYKSLMGTLFHEAGHAFIDVLELKITGKEEDVADQLVAYMLTNDEVGEDYLMTVSYAYSLSAEQASSLDDLPFYDAHSLDAQRAVNFLCYIYGSNPAKFQYFVDDELLHEDRAAGCEAEYHQMVDAWDALLEGKVK